MSVRKNFIVKVSVMLAIVAFLFLLFVERTERKKIELNSEAEAYVAIYCGSEKQCSHIGRDIRAVAQLRELGKWTEGQDNSPSAAKVVPADLLRQLASAEFCLEGDTTDTIGLEIVTDLGDEASIGIVPRDPEAFWSGNLADSSVWVQMKGLFRPCDHRSTQTLNRVLKAIFDLTP